MFISELFVVCKSNENALKHTIYHDENNIVSHEVGFIDLWKLNTSIPSHHGGIVSEDDVHTRSSLLLGSDSMFIALQDELKLESGLNCFC